MGFFNRSQPWRVVATASTLLWVGMVELHAASLISPGALDLIRKSAEPFGLSVSRIYGGGLREKWRGVERKLGDERVQLALCDGDRARCASPAALRFLAIVDNARAREGRGRLGEINRAINLARSTCGVRHWSPSLPAQAIAKIMRSQSS